MFFEEADHVRRRFEESVDQRRVEALAQFMFQIGARRRTVLDDAGPLRQRIARHPGPAAGPGGGTAEHRILLDHYDLLPVPRGRDRRAEAGGAGTYHQDIALDGAGLGGQSGHGQSSGYYFLELDSIIANRADAAKEPLAKLGEDRTVVCALSGAL